MFKKRNRAANEQLKWITLIRHRLVCKGACCFHWDIKKRLSCGVHQSNICSFFFYLCQFSCCTAPRAHLPYSQLADKDVFSALITVPWLCFGSERTYEHLIGRVLKGNKRLSANGGDVRKELLDTCNVSPYSPTPEHIHAFKYIINHA